MKYIVSTVLGLAMIAVLILGGNVNHVTMAAVSDTKIVNIATSSLIVVGPQSVTLLFSQKNFCATRLIGTRSQAVNIAFAGGTNLSTTSLPVSPDQLAGFTLSASTTNPFTSGSYGCGAIYAYADASTTITRSEFLQ